jgi:hypothetical protein
MWGEILREYHEACPAYNIEYYMFKILPTISG